MIVSVPMREALVLETDPLAPVDTGTLAVPVRKPELPER